MANPADPSHPEASRDVQPEVSADVAGELAPLADLLAASRHTLIFTGAGVSTESGIPDFRGPSGLYRRIDPRLFEFAAFVADAAVRRESWRVRAESLLGAVEPNAVHLAIAELAALGIAPVVVTQNVDGLHQRAGSADVIELHGSVRRYECLGCDAGGPIEELLTRLDAGEGDPHCRRCGGILKTATVLFGQPLDPATYERAFALAQRSDVCLAIGSSLQVMPAAYVPQAVVEAGGRLVIVNNEPTALDSWADTVLHAPAGHVLPALVAAVRARLA